MRSFLLLITAFFSTIAFSQFCGTDHYQKQLESEHPEMKNARIQADQELLRKNASNFLANRGISYDMNGNYTGPIYTIPVILHVIEGDNASVTDSELNAWLENANKMYATTYGNGYYPEGDGADGGTVIPIRFVLAQRDPQCTATSGIVRYNGSTLNEYDSYGVKSNGANGATVEQIRALAPHWPESSYFNIYVITGFDGNFQNYGLMGFCGFPTNSDAFYDSFMKMPVVTKQHDSTLAHEFGHGMGLHHPFKGANAQGGECPANTDCQTDNDMVCDTQPCQSLLSTFPTPSNSEINTCTNTNYDGVQYNVMNYTQSVRKFTPGQRTRALQLFLQYRGPLTTSLGGTIPESNANTVTAASCNYTGVSNSTGNTSSTYGAGPTKIILGDINNISARINGLGTNFYEDFTSQSCLNSAFSTSLQQEQQATLKVSIRNPNSNIVKAWIDYNNNGVFEDDEVIASDNIQGTSWDVTTEGTYNFTPPSTAVLDSFLRMRVVSDYGSSVSSCGQLNYGQGEDYLVKITNGNNTSCNTPTNLTTTNLTNTSVDLSWTAGGSETSWVIEYGTTGFTQGNGNTVNATTNPYSLTGLTSNTSYDFYVRATCDNSNSDWSTSHTFTTNNSIPTTVDMVGNVGINTENPKTTLDVRGPIMMKSRTEGGQMYNCTAETEGAMGYDTVNNTIQVCTKDNNDNPIWKTLRYN